MATTQAQKNEIQIDWFETKDAAKEFESAFTKKANHKRKYLQKYIRAVQNSSKKEKHKGAEISAAKSHFDKSLEQTYHEIESENNLNLTDAQWLTEYFKQTTKSFIPPNDGGSTLPERITFDVDGVYEAAISCGYGLATKDTLSNPANEKIWADKPFNNSWSLRAQYAISFIDFNKAQPYDFYKSTEASEKNTTSFLLGSTLSFIAAKQWIESAGRHLKGYFHAGLISQSLIKSSADFFKSSEKSISANVKFPDYIALDSDGKIHIFEAKAGKSSYKNEAIRKGTHQVSVLPSYVTLSEDLRELTSSIASSSVVFTLFAPGHDIKVSLYDPIPIELSSDSYIFNQDLALILLREFSFNLFQALPQATIINNEIEWRNFGSMYLGMSKHTFPEDAKISLDIYRKIKKALPESAKELIADELKILQKTKKDKTGNIQSTMVDYEAYASDPIYQVAFTFLGYITFENNHGPGRINRDDILNGLRHFQFSTREISFVLEFLEEIGVIKSRGRVYDLYGVGNWRITFNSMTESQKNHFHSSPIGTYLWKGKVYDIASKVLPRLHKGNHYKAALAQAERPSDFLLYLTKSLKLDEIEEIARQGLDEILNKFKDRPGENYISKLQGGLVLARNPMNPQQEYRQK